MLGGERLDRANLSIHARLELQYQVRQSPRCFRCGLIVCSVLGSNLVDRFPKLSRVDAGGSADVRWAARVPDAANTEVEVRPILDMSGWEF